MSVVNHQPSVMPPLYLNELWQVGDIAVHTVQAFNHDQHALKLIANRLKQSVERFGIIMRERAPLGARQGRAGKDAIVGKAFVDDQILRPNYSSYRRNIG